MGVKKTLHDVAVIGVGVALVLTLFLIHYSVSQISTLSQEKLTGNVIQISEGDGPFVQIDEDDHLPPDEPQQQTPPEGPLSRNLQCWAGAGMTRSDIDIVGNLLENTPCKEAPKKAEIEVTRQNGCIIIDSDKQMRTSLCDTQAGEQPKISLTLPESEGLHAPEIPEEQNYMPWFLFFLFGCAVLIVSRQHSFAFGFKERDEDHTEREEGKEIKYVEAAPIFSDKPLKANIEELEKVHKKLLAEYAAEKQSFASIAILPEEVTSMIKEFNAQTKIIYGAIKRNDAATARKAYLALFPLYTRLYNALKEERRQELQEVISYLHDQITILEKSSTITNLIEQAYQQAEAHKVRKTTNQKTKTIEKLQKEINKLRELLKEKKK